MPRTRSTATRPPEPPAPHVPDAFSLRPNRTAAGWRVDFHGGSVHAEGPFAFQEALAAAVEAVARLHAATPSTVPDAHPGNDGGR